MISDFKLSIGSTCLYDLAISLAGLGLWYKLEISYFAQEPDPIAQR